MPQERNETRDRGVDAVLEQAAARFGTPVYVLDAETIAARAADVEAAFPAPWIHQYSLKANDLPAVVSIMAERGWGANVVSSGEWSAAREADVADPAVTFEGIGKTDTELREAVQSAARGEPLRWLAVESPAEARVLGLAAAAARLGEHALPPIDVLLRLNPRVQPETTAGLAVGAGSSKFGMYADEIRALSAHSRGSGVRIRGIHVHVGSDLRDVGAWVDAGVQAVRLLGELATSIDSADTVDFGGGFPLTSQGAPGPALFREALDAALAAEGLPWPAVRAVEPGRYLVGGAGWLVSSILHSRPRSPHAQQVVLDAGMTELIRPALYGSRHAVRALTRGPGRGGLLDTAVEGPVCESTDTFGAHPLPPLRRGDLVGIEGAGAYAASFTSRYNGRPPPPEVMVWPDGTLQLCDRAAVPAREVQRPRSPRRPELRPA
ncbi:MAG: diaminopimelate decarboxylase [Nocardioidaceae bacterium]|jgi:diaminopimelate decarboxylase|nr:diaminopimelate decarboxylase [Nocardioidaceae bacterium]